MIRIAVCDDCITQLKLMEGLLEHYRQERKELDPKAQLFSSPDELIRQLDHGAIYDIFVLDMLMPQKSGIEVGKLIRARALPATIIYITAFPDYALEAFDVQAEQYILKPIDTKKLFEALDRAISRLAATEKLYTLKISGGVVRIPFSQIVCAENVGRVLRLHLADGTTQDSVYLREPFESYLTALLACGDFVQVHKSFVINLWHAKKITAERLETDIGFVSPISRRHAATVKKRYLDYVR